MNTAKTAVISRLNANGDGITDDRDGAPAIPFSAPGDEYDLSQTPTVRTKDSAARSDPVCPHFGTCGGCRLQHLDEETYAAYKRQLVVDALSAAGLEAEVTDLRSFPVGSRRRTTLTYQPGKAGAAMGYFRRQSHELIDIQSCAVLDPQLAQALTLLRALCAMVPGKRPLTMTVLNADNGLDISWQSDRDQIKPAAAQAISQFAARNGIMRLIHNGDLVFQLEDPVVRFGPAAVTPPAGSFLQAVAAAEQEMADLACHHLGQSARILDLFCGAGSFSFPLARKAEVQAYDSAHAAIAALESARDHTPGLSPIRAAARDLFKTPVMTEECNAFDGALFDPPRAGAEAQARQLAGSSVRRIVAVSCNPKTLARDLKILCAGGYVIEAVTPIDQFRYSPHIEAVATLSKAS